ncbi:MAG: CocE/NonD family hydrolase C-terminal non-catalytic domain-containing protein, partial [Pseudomonadota bacterium]|nr:CocE/NonD family hydrolase C-terminal non-catalytic domain-containing protein [Pseudomonadota bacterium]
MCLRQLPGVDCPAVQLTSYPPYRAWMMDTIKPEVSLITRPGVWVGQDGVAGAPTTTLHLNGTVLAKAAGPVDATARTEAAHGVCAGEFFPFGFGPGELPADQRPDDALALCFDSPPQQEEVEILGAPTLSLTLRADQTHAQVVVRLCDLRPDGTSGLITMGLLNLRHCNSHDAPVDVVPGTDMEITLPLDHIAYRLPAGHRLRIAIAPSYFPFAFPSPTPVTLHVTAGALTLPQRTGPEWTGFGPPRAATPLATEPLAPRVETKRIIHDHGARTITTEIIGDDGITRDTTHGLETGICVHETFTIPLDT